MAKHRNKRTPKLRFSTLRGIGWHVTFRDPDSGVPKKHRFGIREQNREPEARVAYHRWLAEYLESGPSRPQPKRRRKDAPSGGTVSRLPSNKRVIPGSIMHVASSCLSALEARVRQPSEPRRQGTIAKAVYTCTGSA